MSSVQDFSDINFDINILNVIDNEKRTNEQDEIVSMNDTMPQNNISDTVSRRFRNHVSTGPVYVCSCCTRTWFRKNVQKAKTLYSFPLGQQCLQDLKSKDDIEWACVTCTRPIKNGKVASCATINE